MSFINYNQGFDELSVTRQYISLLERGEAQATISVGIEIANKLDTCVYTLFGFDECECCNVGTGGNQMIYLNPQRYKNGDKYNK